MDEYSLKLASLLTVVNQTTDAQARSQLYKLYNNCRKKFDELSKESVECRRMKKVTTKYTEIEQQLQECIHNFEQWTFFAKLIY
jgi:predicted nuclease with TOPRIM domain